MKRQISVTHSTFYIYIEAYIFYCIEKRKRKRKDDNENNVDYDNGLVATVLNWTCYMHPFQGEKLKFGKLKFLRFSMNFWEFIQFEFFKLLRNYCEFIKKKIWNQHDSKCVLPPYQHLKRQRIMRDITFDFLVVTAFFMFCSSVFFSS